MDKHKLDLKERITTLLKTKKGKALAISLGIVLVLAILMAIPITRYGILGTVVKKSVKVTVIDSKTKKPVSEATVTVGGVSAQSDKDGIASLSSVPVNDGGIEVTKQYFASKREDFTVPVFAGSPAKTVELEAQGRQVTVSVVNKITQQPVSDITIDSNGIKAISNAQGSATMILPPEQDTWNAKLSGNGFTVADVQLTNDTGEKANVVGVTPSGSVAYLSKATGKINVMRSDLDGKNAKVIVPATGQESDGDTSLLASRDWKYAILLATREDDKENVYLVDIEKGTFSLVDEGDASFSLVGWSNHNFIYNVTRNNIDDWKPKHDSYKSYNADTGTLTTLVDSKATGDSDVYAYEYFTDPYLLDDELVYVSDWYDYQSNDEYYPSLVSLKISTGEVRTLKEFKGSYSLSPKLYAPEELYLSTYQDDGDTLFYEYEDGAVKTAKGVTENTFNNDYPTYLVSPSGNKVLWSEERDGKTVVLIGDKEGKNGKILSARSDYLPYGWFGKDDNYILLSKNDSELYIADAARTIDQTLKVTDYHKARSYGGYGYGYGGF